MKYRQLGRSGLTVSALGMGAMNLSFGTFLLIIHDGHLNLAHNGHYNFAVTFHVKAQLKCPLSGSIKMTTLISHSLY